MYVFRRLITNIPHPLKKIIKHLKTQPHILINTLNHQLKPNKFNEYLI